MPNGSATRPAVFGLARLSARPGGRISYSDPAAFLARIAADPVAREAISVSSGSLSAVLDKVSTGVPVSPKKIRRAALSVARYVSRMSHRSTPFGLMAGVAAVRFGDSLKVRIGTSHHKHVRPDMGWLLATIRPWEQDPVVLPHLLLVSNNLAFPRGSRLVLPYVLDDGDHGLPDAREQTVRDTAAVQKVLALTARPVPFGDLVADVCADFPDAGQTVVTGMIRQLIERGFLLTNLRPPPTADEPIQHVVDLLAPIPEYPGRRGLIAISDALRAYAKAPIGAGLPQWRTAVAAMDRLHTKDRAIQVDLAMDAELDLPFEVTTELAKAVEIGWRLAPAGLAPVDQLADYRTKFLSHYGSETLVPIKELVDPQRGIGPPAGYLLPAGSAVLAQRTNKNAERDRVLLGVAQLAAARGEREVVLDDELIGKLERPDAGRPGSIEVCTQLLADSAENLLAGDFRLAVSGLNFTRLGAMFGRLLPVVPELRPAVTQLIAERIPDAVPAQLVTALVGARLGNVSQVPPLTQHVLAVGLFADRSEPGAVDLNDLVVGADQDRFFVLSARTGEEIVPLPLHALNATNHLPNIARLLVEIGASHTPPWQIWSWGAGEQLPYLPRIRHGRTILSPARWLVDPVLTAGQLDWGQWLEKFEQWRHDWHLPEVVYAVRSDRRLRVDLTSPVDLRLLYDDLRNQPSIVLQEEPDGTFGWAQGHCTEIVVPFGPPGAPPPRPAGPVAATTRRVSQRSLYLPGGEWLSVRIYADAPRHPELLAEQLPSLVDGAHADRWFFLRYADERPHLRVRFHGDAAVHDWATRLASTGLVSDVEFDAYRPEVDRYGGPAAIAAAEQVFCADSQAVLTQLALRASGKLDLPPELLAAANFLDIAQRLGGDWRHWFLGTFPKGGYHAAFQRHRAEALRLLDPADGWRELAGLPGGVELLAAWENRAEALHAYGPLVRTNPSTAFSSILHMHHNRSSGIDRGAENAAYAVARGTLQTCLDRERHNGSRR